MTVISWCVVNQFDSFLMGHAQLKSFLALTRPFNLFLMAMLKIKHNDDDDDDGDGSNNNPHQRREEGGFLYYILLVRQKKRQVSLFS